MAALVTSAQLAHLQNNASAFEDAFGDDMTIEEYIDTYGVDRPDIYYRICADLGLDPVEPDAGDIQAMVQHSVMEALGGLIPGGALPGMQQSHPAVPIPTPVQFTFEDVLAEVDPKDSKAGLAMLDWLLKSDRLRRIGVLEGGQGYMFIYEEPKGSEKEGYRPGATTGDRIVDHVAEQAEASGQAKLVTGLCRHCMSAVQDDGSGLPVLSDDEADDREKCPGNGGGPHEMVN